MRKARRSVKRYSARVRFPLETGSVGVSSSWGILNDSLNCEDDDGVWFMSGPTIASREIEFQQFMTFWCARLLSFHKSDGSCVSNHKSSPVAYRNTTPRHLPQSSSRIKKFSARFAHPESLSVEINDDEKLGRRLFSFASHSLPHHLPSPQIPFAICFVFIFFASSFFFASKSSSSLAKSLNSQSDFFLFFSSHLNSTHYTLKADDEDFHSSILSIMPFFSFLSLSDG